MWVSPRHQIVVGEALADARQRVGMTQQALARKLGRLQSFVSAYERGQRRIDLIEFLMIASGLGADPRKLFSTIVSRCVDLPDGPGGKHKARPDRSR